MQRDGFASVWIGEGDCRENLYPLLEYSISDNGLGDFVPAPFCQALGIEKYEPDYFGGKFFPKKLTRLKLLFYGESFLPQLLDRWPEIPPSNCIVGLYDYEYGGEIPEFDLEGFHFTFLGAFPFE